MPTPAAVGGRKGSIGFKFNSNPFLGQPWTSLFPSKTKARACRSTCLEFEIRGSRHLPVKGRRLKGVLLSCSVSLCFQVHGVRVTLRSLVCREAESGIPGPCLILMQDREATWPGN
ncbi:hypothetical protein BDW62DRAFT_54979 [Aspergillus aurantiobrunneus]